ncbi:MAG TPA: phosphonate C-P lyase system protein PhnH [Stellaceae bacterium]|nr:phosphonate C-P lyase system protein PhnH [Stellaceae bacterium]
MSDVVHSGDFGALEPGFGDPVHDAQASFRAVLDAMANPGRIVTMPVALPCSLPLGAAAAAIALSLCDGDTPVWLDTASAAASSYLIFHCGAPLAAMPGEASFAFLTDPAAMPPLDSFALGTDEYPERSATLVIEVPRLADAGGLRLRGPGIKGEARLEIAGLPARFWVERAALAELFPRGLDILFVCGDALVAVPRSTQIVL